MSVTRFVPYAEPEFPWYSGIEEREEGEYVLYSDYAALEARCAGLERERDALQSAHDKQMDRADKSHKAWPESEGVVIILERELREEKQERDALQAKLAAAEEVLLAIGSLPDNLRHLSMSLARAALSDTTTGEVQP